MAKKILYSILALLWLYVIAGFLYPIVPLTKDIQYTLMSDKFYTATWTQVYSNGEEIPGLSPRNSYQVGHFVLVSAEKVYFRGEKLDAADPHSLKIVSSNAFTLVWWGIKGELIQYLYDDNNIYIWNSLVLPRNNKRAEVIYAEYILKKENEVK